MWPSDHVKYEYHILIGGTGNAMDFWIMAGGNINTIVKKLTAVVANLPKHIMYVQEIMTFFILTLNIL